MKRLRHREQLLSKDFKELNDTIFKHKFSTIALHPILD
jgi:hypothetical protein